MTIYRPPPKIGLIVILAVIYNAYECENRKFQTIGEYLKSPFYTDISFDFEGMIKRNFKTNLVDSEIFKPPDHFSDFKFRDIFTQFKKEFSVDFSNNENEFRYQLFKKNYLKIEDHNKNNAGFKMAMNQFMIKLPEEFQSEFLQNPTVISANQQVKIGRLLEDDNASVMKRLESLPSIVDWTLKRKVSPVKSQEKCSGCYVFSAIAALEAAILIRFNRSMIFSEQEIIECTKGFKNNGCAGGQPGFVYDYIKINGVNLSTNYKYTGIEDKCKAPTRFGVFKRLVNYVKPDPNVISLIEFLQYGPVVVNHYIPDDFKYYASGVFYTPDCYHEAVINHSSLLVGYNFTVDAPYFVMKNSWGVKWGEQGYYKVPIGKLDLKNPGFCYLANNGYNVFPIVQ